MNYTEKYHLPQWEETDRIMRTDFNEAMANIEEGLTDLGTSWAVGTYNGWGSGKSHKVTIGFRPRLLLIHTIATSAGLSAENIGVSYFFHADQKINDQILTYEDDGFTVTGINNLYPQVNADAKYYVYIAFR